MRERRHSPKFENVQWDKEGLLDKLQNWPSGKKINWSALGRESNIPGANKGQVVKEFAKESGINVHQLDKRPPIQGSGLANSGCQEQKCQFPHTELQKA